MHLVQRIYLDDDDDDNDDDDDDTLNLDPLTLNHTCF